MQHQVNSLKYLCPFKTRERALIAVVPPMWEDSHSSAGCVTQRLRSLKNDSVTTAEFMMAKYGCEAIKVANCC